MRAYIRIVSDEETIRLIHRRTNITRARIKQLKANRQDTQDYLWNWETPAFELDPSDVDSGVKELLGLYKPKFPMIRSVLNPEADVYLEIVAYHGTGDRSEGLFLSPETVTLLNELGGALDYDAVQDLE